MSDSNVYVVPIVLEAHPNADSLSIVRIDGYTCVVRTDEFKDVQRAAYILPDSIITEEMAAKYTGGKKKIRAVKLRGVVSHGLLVHCDEPVGTDVTAALGVTHYEPPINLQRSGKMVKGPKMSVPHYDVEGRKALKHLIPNEQIVLTEKLHGTNSRYVYYDNKLNVGSRTTWKEKDEKNPWWIIAAKYSLEEKLSALPGLVFYGEVYGMVQKMRYGHTAADPLSWALFDIWDGTTWLNWEAVKDIAGTLQLPMVPEIYQGEWHEALMSLAAGKTHLGGGHIREGVVVKPLIERIDPKGNRVIAKIINDAYLLGDF